LISQKFIHGRPKASLGSAFVVFFIPAKMAHRKVPVNTLNQLNLVNTFAKNLNSIKPNFVNAGPLLNSNFLAKMAAIPWVFIPQDHENLHANQIKKRK
jgi:hypothetical protein